MREGLLVVRPKKFIVALQKAGFELRRQSGSRTIMYKRGIRRPISIPAHVKDPPKGTLGATIREAGLTRDEFLKSLQVAIQSFRALCI